MPDCTVRPARTADVAAIRDVARAAWTATYGELLEQSTIDAALAEWYEPAAVGELVAAEDVAAFVATVDGPADDRDRPADDRPADDRSVVGYLTEGPDERESEATADAATDVPPAQSIATVGACYVLPEYWGEGIGTVLLERFLAHARDRGCAAVEAAALAENDVAASFYRSRGFSAVHEREAELFGERVTDAVFRRSLE